MDPFVSDCKVMMKFDMFSVFSENLKDNNKKVKALQLQRLDPLYDLLITKENILCLFPSTELYQGRHLSELVRLDHHPPDSSG